MITADPTATATDVSARWSRTVPFAVVGTVCIVAGGLAAAVTRPTDWELGSWVAAYLVLVTGVAQIALGAGQAFLAREVPSRTLVLVECVGWNLGSALVILGTLIDVPLVVSLGGIPLVVTLALLVRGVRGERDEHEERDRSSVLLQAFRALVVLMLVSIPIGLTMSWIRGK